MGGIECLKYVGLPFDLICAVSGTVHIKCLETFGYAPPYGCNEVQVSWDNGFHDVYQ